MFKILFQSTELIALDKPAGFHVHRPENSRFVIPENKLVLQNLRRQIQKHLYPVHRLDAATSGVLLMALTQDAAREISILFRENRIQKTYWSVLRGYLPDQGRIDLPLELDSTGDLVAARTDYLTKARIELPFAVGKIHPTARYSLVEVRPQTGRYHQIRRHFNRLNHPVIGDVTHGDGHHNKFFRTQLELPGLCLRAMSLELDNWRGQRLCISAEVDNNWQKINKLFTKAADDGCSSAAKPQ